MPNFFTALDIGSSSVKGAVARKNKEGQLSIVSAFKYPSVGIRKGVIIDFEEATGNLEQIIDDIRKISKQAALNIYININGDHIKSKFARGISIVSRPDKEIQEEDKEQAVQAARTIKMMPNYDLIHEVVAEFFVDEIGDIKDPIGMTGHRLEVNTLLVEGFAPHVKGVADLVKSAGGDVSGIVFNPLASSKAVLSNRQRELGVLFIDLGAATTSYVIYDEGKAVHAGSIPLGSNYITNDIAIGLKISVDLAEKLKQNYGRALAAKVPRRDRVKLSEMDPAVKNDAEISLKFLAEIIEVRLEEIFDLINNELKAIGRVVQLPAGLVISGGGANLENIDDLARQLFRLPAQVGYPNIEMFEVLNPTHIDLVSGPDFASALGLLLWNYEKNYNGSSFSSVARFLKNLLP